MSSRSKPAASLRPKLRRSLTAPGPTRLREPLPPTGRAGRNLPAAIGVGLGLIGLIAFTLWWAKLAFLAILVIALGMGLWELASAFAVRSIRVPLPPLWLGTACIVLAAYWWGPEAMLTAFVATVGAAFAWRVAQSNDTATIRDATVTVFATAYLPLAGGFVALLIAPVRGVTYVLLYIAVTVANDVGGYAAGVLFGRHPIAPTISPKKSWEGLIGSWIFACAVGLVGMWVLAAPWWLGLLLGFLGVLAATTGDLAESLLKRDLGLKDMGSILPGHGGLMDRLDSLVMTAPMCYLLLPWALEG